MKKILVDTTYIRTDTIYKSLSIYIFRFLDSINLNDISNFKILALEESEDYLRRKYPNFEYVIYNPYSSCSSGNRIVRLIRRFRMYKKTVNNSKCDVLFVPNDLVTFCAVKTKLKKITVIHDLKSLNEKSQTSLSYLIFWVYYYLLIKFSNIVVAISKYTKEDILRYFKCFSDDKIKVVYNSVNLSTQDSTEQIAEYNDYILFVNTLLPYKNVMTLLKSFVLLKHKIALNLIIVGQTTSYWESEVMSFIRKEKLDDRIIHLENISDASLYALYKHASLFVTTSLKEGFGYTPIEAAMCCCPVVSSKCEALGDTTQNLLYYYEPAKDEVKLSEQILHVLNNPPSKDKLQHIAKIYRESYSIEKQYKSLIHILDKD